MITNRTPFKVEDEHLQSFAFRKELAEKLAKFFMIHTQGILINIKMKDYNNVHLSYFHSSLLK